MKKIILYSILCFQFSISTIAQQKTDSLHTKNLNEIILVGTKGKLYEKETKILATVDQYLQQSPKIDMVKRGAYAWEPLINGMTTERTVITIDGMRIFGACTDKMDPVTSYVEVSNLSDATISSGQQGACHGNTIGGSLDLKRNQNPFDNLGWQATVNSGYETNNQQKIIGGSINYADSTFYVDTDAMYRDAENYKAGGGNEILYSQFKKFNVSSTVGAILSQKHLLEGSIIYDKATDVGYPALPMDVSLAEALITSLKYHYTFQNRKLKTWETKLYYNTITHTMDDTTRPEVAIHMDMPGWSDTYGWYSTLNGKFSNHHITVNSNGFYNKSVAEMTMYPENPNENLMFMYTWPDVRTFYTGFYAEDIWELNCHSNLTFSTALGSHSNTIASEFGLHSLQIFYPNADDTKSHFLKSFSGAYSYDKNGWTNRISVGYGERAPSVSEGYGFYLFNSFDGFDYIGNPNLKNENSFEAAISIGKKKEKWNVKLTSSYFLIHNYIIGLPTSTVAPMTIGANGVKIYSPLDFATIFSTDFQLNYQISNKFDWNSNLKYTLGKDNHNDGLPFMSPFAYKTSLLYRNGRFNLQITLLGNTTQTEFNSFHGEDKTPSYAIVNCNAGYKFYIEKTSLSLNAGIENIFDKNYSTFSDWRNIPRMGRNIYLNIIFKL